MIKMKGLGRGLDALLSGSDKPQGDEQRNLPVDRLKPGKYQPRTHMDDAALAELAASIKSQGVMQPILVRAIDPPNPLITDGFGYFPLAFAVETVTEGADGVV